MPKRTGTRNGPETTPKQLQGDPEASPKMPRSGVDTFLKKAPIRLAVDGNTADDFDASAFASSHHATDGNASGDDSSDGSDGGTGSSSTWARRQCQGSLNYVVRACGLKTRRTRRWLCDIVRMSRQTLIRPTPLP